MSDTAKIFSIDVDAEIRKLTDRRYKASFESVLDLIRLAVDAGPNAIEITMGRGQLVIKAIGSTPQTAVFRLASRIYNPTLSPSDRQDAVTELEEKYQLFVLGAFSNNPSKVSIEWVAGQKRAGLLFAPHKVPKSYTPDGTATLKLTVKRRMGGAKEERAVRSRCRFASVPISVNGVAVSGGKRIDYSLLEVDVASGSLRGVVGLPIEGDVSHITRLSRGIITEEIVLPVTGGLMYSAVIEDGKDIWEETHALLRSAGRKLYRSLAVRYGELNELGQKRAEELLFERYWHTRQRELLVGVKAFSIVGGGAYDFHELKQKIKAGEVYAIDRDDKVDHYMVTNRFVLLLDKKQRGFIESVLKNSLPAPPRRAKFRSLREQLRSNYKKTVLFCKRRLFAVGPALLDNELDDSERRFLRAIQEGLKSGDFAIQGESEADQVKVTLGKGDQLPWMRFQDDGALAEYRIPRSNPMVQWMVQAVTKDPAYLYPALVLLSDGAVSDR